MAFFLLMTGLERNLLKVCGTPGSHTQGEETPQNPREQVGQIMGPTLSPRPGVFRRGQQRNCEGFALAKCAERQDGRYIATCSKGIQEIARILTASFDTNHDRVTPISFLFERERLKMW